MNRISICRPALRSRAPLLQGCALALALAAAGQFQPARATGFQGTGMVVPGSGSASIIQGATSDTITVDTSEVVIDWTPSDTAGTGTIDFLPAANSVLYVDNSSAGLSGYTVLNRILPVDGSGNPVLGRPVVFNGTVQTQLGGANFPVGNVWFYSPGGIIAGPTAVFDVGSLVLTTSLIDDTAGFGSSGSIAFTGTPNSTSRITIQPGAQINAIAPGSYVALVAPSIQQFGTVNVNGSVAYVGAEAATITINGGLFDIAISTGTDDANGVIHTGTTNLTPDTGTQRAFIAAVPKNAALTMLLTGTFGYTAAASATGQDSAVILSAGHDISGGVSLDPPNGTSTQAANISLGNSSFSMAVDGRASGSITINPTGGGTILFGENADFKAGTSLTAGVDDGEAINAAMDLSLHAGRNGTGGNATLYANGSSSPGLVAVGGALTVSSEAFGLDAMGTPGGNATGGTTQILINGGSVTANEATFSADGRGGEGSNGGNGTGGNVLFSVQDGLFATPGSVTITADGYGGPEEPDGTSGSGFGGNVLIRLLPGNNNNASIVADSLDASANGYGNPIPGDYSGVGNGGMGQGGSTRFDVLGGALNATSISLGAIGLGGPAGVSSTSSLFTAGNGIGGQSVFNLGGGFADIGTLSIFSTGEGGMAQAPFSVGQMGNAGNGTGGTSQFIATSGTMNIGDLFVHAFGLGGATEAVFFSNANVGGNGNGGTAEFLFSGADLSIASLQLFANGIGGAGGEGLSTGDAGSGGNGAGGNAAMSLASGNLDVTALAIAANGVGGAGGNQQGSGNAGSGGNGVGGSALLDGNDAGYTLGAVTVEAQGLGGAAGTGGSGVAGDGTGGFLRVSNRDTVAPALGRSMDSLSLNVSGVGTAILSGRMELSDVATFTGGGLVITGDLTGLGLGSAANAASGFYYSSLGDVKVTTVSAPVIDIRAAGAVTVDGLLSGTSIAIASSDILIGSGGQVGSRTGTATLDLTNNDTGRQSYIGGADNSAGYSLSAVEIGRLFADNIRITGSTGQNVVLDSFTMSSRATTTTGNLGATGSLSISSLGSLRVVGDVALTGLGAGNQLFLSATDAVEVDAANASISLSDANGGLAGQLNFDADEVFVATSGAIADVRAARSVTAMNIRLGLNDGVVRNTGVIRAATIFADVRDGLYIQNVGASENAVDRRGFAALTDTLDIATSSSSTRIIVNGQLVDSASGGLLSGLAVMPLVRINGVVGPTSGNFDPRSTVNGCAIASPLVCVATIDIPGVPPPHDTIDEPLDPDSATGGATRFPNIVVELKGFEPFGYPPLIDEPVTGAGNDDLWMPACKEGENGCAAP